MTLKKVEEGEYVCLGQLSKDGSKHSAFTAEMLTQFQVTEDGCIGLAKGNQMEQTSTDLVCGLGQPSILLVARDSPLRLIFKDLKEALNGNIMTRPLHHNPVKIGELLSHPGCAMVNVQKKSSAMSSLKSQFFFLGLGKAEDAYPLVYNGDEIIGSNGRGHCLDAAFKLSGGSTMIFVTSHDPQNPAVTHRVLAPFGLLKLVANGDGSVSPNYAPHLAIGVLQVGLANEITSGEQMAEARKAARTPPRYRIILLRCLLAHFFLLMMVSFEYSFWEMISIRVFYWIFNYMKGYYLSLRNVKEYYDTQSEKKFKIKDERKRLEKVITEGNAIR